MSATNLQASASDSDLPEGWAPSHLSEVCQINPPKAPSDSLEDNQPVTFVPMPAVDADKGAITAPQGRPFSEVRRGFTCFQDDDVIMAKITPCMENGKAAIARGLTNGLGFGSTEFHVFRPNGAVLPEYVYFFIRQESFRRAAETEMTGSVGQKRVPQRFLEETELPLPPKDEQERIVEKIEQSLARVNAARERLACVPAILKHFRQAVLAAACSGRLTADWRDRHPVADSAKELLQAIRSRRHERVREQGFSTYAEPRRCDESECAEAHEEWALSNVEELSCLVTSGSRGWAKYYSESGPLFIRAQDINTDQLRLDNAAHVTPPHNAEGRRTRVQFGDLLVTITGANVTKSALVDKQVDEAYVSQHVALIRPVDPLTAPFLYLWIVSPLHGRAKLLDEAYGAGKPGLNLDNVKQTVLALPSLQEQREIVRRVEALFKLAEAIEKRVATAKARAEKLTQAIVAKAFRGELVPTEAELARREGRSYELASALLERIRAQSQSPESAQEVRKPDSRKREQKRWPKKSGSKTRKYSSKS